MEFQGIPNTSNCPTSLDHGEMRITAQLVLPRYFDFYGTRPLAWTEVYDSVVTQTDSWRGSREGTHY